MAGSVKERLIAFIEYKGLSKNKFEKVCGFSQRYVSNISVSIQPDKLERISSNYPDLNIGWLITGEGDMILRPSTKNVKTENRSTFIMKDISYALQEYFRSNKVSQDDIAKLLGVSQAYVSALLSGKKAFGKKQAQKFAELFGLSPSWLLTGEGEMLRKSFGVECEDDEREKEKGSVVAQRLKAFLDFKKISVRTFEMSCGFSNGWVNSIKEQIRLSAITEIASLYPELNLNWLFTGLGDMLLPEPASKASQDSPKLEVNPTNDIHHNQQVVIANWDDLRGVLEDVIKEQFAKKK